MKASKGVLNMLIKALFLLILSSPALALVDFPAGKCELEGRLSNEGEVWFLSINPKTNSEIRLRLNNFSTKEKDPPQNIRAEVLFKKSLSSYAGEVEFLKLVREINPFKEPIRYSNKNIKEACPSKK